MTETHLIRDHYWRLPPSTWTEVERADYRAWAERQHRERLESGWYDSDE